MAWFGLLAEFSSDPKISEKRSTVRRKLRFESMLTASRPQSKVVVLNLSEAGLMLHSHDELAVGETFEVTLPEAGSIEARVVWRRSPLYGCEFLSPVTRGMISAVLLKVAHDRPQ
jgi:hypothetical protein